jgi:predicted AAA+ superfamily ATPase
MIGAKDILDVWRGRIGEQIVAQELLTLNNDINQTRSFWTRGKGESGAEVDLVWRVGSKLIPIEVKSGHNSHLRSLHSFIDNASIDFAVRVWSGEFVVNDVTTIRNHKPFRLVNIPFYLVGNLERIVNKYI